MLPAKYIPMGPFVPKYVNDVDHLRSVSSLWLNRENDEDFEVVLTSISVLGISRDGRARITEAVPTLQ